ncbi:hypothetical protein DFH06DRAFT_1351738 [Mycena polygramma]|nr:hypothetical protein DFH06DRAFT_1351738 [Mycena polygramma]
MDDAGEPSRRRRSRDEDAEGPLKRVVVAGPGREQLEIALYAAYHTLEAQKKEIENLTKDRDVVIGNTALEEELEMQFLSDQTEIRMLKESYKQVASDLERVKKTAIDRGDENIHLRARLEAQSSPRAGRKPPRTSRLSILRNAGDNQDVPLDPEPISGSSEPIDSTTEHAQDTQEVTVEILQKVAVEVAQLQNAKIKKRKKITFNLSKDAPVVPTDKSVINDCNALLRTVIRDKFGVKRAMDFMAHVPVSTEEMRASVVPDPADFRWDFSEGYQKSRWNRTIVGRLVDAALETDGLDIDLLAVDRKWLEGQVYNQLARHRTEWARPQQKVVDGLPETKGEAEQRSFEYIKYRQVYTTSLSSKHRKYTVRVKTIVITIEIKTTQGIAKDIATWERFLKLLKLLGPSGMSSEEEDEVETGGERHQIYRVKVCWWRNPKIVDYLRIIDNETKRMKKRIKGVKALTRHRTDEIGRSEAVKGLPAVLYEQDWLNRLEGTPFYEDLEVSKEAFALFVAATDRM